MYQELAVSEGAPKTVKGWYDLITKVLPKVNEHLRARTQSREGDKAGRVLSLKAKGMSRAERKKSTP
jgi:hypothetical protein